MHMAPNRLDLRHRKFKSLKETQPLNSPHTNENKKHELLLKRRQRAPVVRRHPPSFECPGIPLIEQDAISKEEVRKKLYQSLIRTPNSKDS